MLCLKVCFLKQLKDMNKNMTNSIDHIAYDVTEMVNIHINNLHIKTLIEHITKTGV